MLNQTKHGHDHPCLNGNLKLRLQTNFYILSIHKPLVWSVQPFCRVLDTSGQNRQTSKVYIKIWLVGGCLGGYKRGLPYVPPCGCPLLNPHLAIFYIIFCLDEILSDISESERCWFWILAITQYLTETIHFILHLTG